MSTPRFLFGPADSPSFTDRFLAAPVEAGRWAAFSAACPSFDAATANLDSPPAAILLWPGYASVPAWVWSAPVPVVALAHDGNFLWSQYRQQLTLADLILTDAPTAGRLRRAGISGVRVANLFGLDRHFLAELDTPETDRDIDVLFVGNLHPAVQGERLAWLGRLAGLADRYRVVIRTGTFGAAYRALLRRAKVVFNLSVRGECNLRALEAAASGAVLLQEAKNGEVPLYLTPATEYVPYTADDLEERIDHYLSDEPERQRVADRARRRVRESSFDGLVEAAVGAGGAGWSEVLERAARRQADPPRLSPAVRMWQRASLAGPDADLTLAADLRAAGADHALAFLARSPSEAEPLLCRAADAGNRVSAVGLAAALTELGRADEVVDVLRRTLADLDATPALTPVELETCPYPTGFDHLRVGWDRAGWDHPDNPDGEAAAKLALLRCRAWSLLAELTKEPVAYESAAAACPQIPTVRAALGCALARAGRFDEAVEHLAFAAEANPFDARAAAARIAALTDAGRTSEVQQAQQARQRLARAMAADPDPQAAPSAPPAPTSASHARVVALAPAEFAGRFGSPDTSMALCGFTPVRDTHIVLALVNHLKPRRVLEVGTAAGHMTANLTAWTPPDAVVYSLGIVTGGSSGEAEQQYEVPARAQFARHADHFGTAAKALLVTADSREYDFTRQAPLDFAFIDGGHDVATVRSDSLGAYAALRSGGCLAWHDWGSRTAWVKVQEAVESLGFPEPIYHAAGTEVAFLFKGEGVGAVAGADLPRVALAWDGEFAAAHSLAAVNRAVCVELAGRGQDLGLIRSPTYTPAGSTVALPAEFGGTDGP